MNKFQVSICIVLLLIGFQAVGQQSQVIEDLTIQSRILDKEKKFALYLPPGYDESNRDYPVVYLLHGAGSGTNKHQDWIKLGKMQKLTDSAIASGNIESLIVVMPDAEMTYYMNNAKGNYQFEDYFFQELMPYVESEYRIKSSKESRAVIGLSMGGFGALIYGFHHPELFSAAVGLSAAIRTDDQINALSLQGYLQRYQVPMGNLTESDERITDFWNNSSPLYLVEHLEIEKLKSINFYLDIGDEDAFVQGNKLFHEALKRRNVDHSYRFREGKHNWDFWKSGLVDALRFTQGLKKN